ncbi:MAG: hypothetical protein IT456_00350 [Planctomycetes bacterium]|jgi:hypothetical protein|nr:hypothetical protein [Planctomycetota bacterium]
MSSGLLTLPGLRMRVRAPSPAATEPTSPARWHRASERLRRWTGLPPLLTALLVAHLAFCLVRFPAGAVAKRHESVQEWQERGADGWCYRNADEETRRVARWLCENVQPGQIVRYMGGEQGALQMLAPLLFPALLVRNDSKQRWPADREVFGLAAPWLPMPAGTVPVVKCSLEALRLEYR